MSVPDDNNGNTSKNIDSVSIDQILKQHKEKQMSQNKNGGLGISQSDAPKQSTQQVNTSLSSEQAVPKNDVQEGVNPVEFLTSPNSMPFQNTGFLPQQEFTTVFPNSQQGNQLMIPNNQNNMMDSTLQVNQPMSMPQNLVAHNPPPTGFVSVEFGATMSKFPIDRDKFSKGIVYRRGIISREVMIAKYHWEEGMGAYFCFGGVCCERRGAPQLRYIVPVVAYDSDPITAQPRSRNFELFYLQLSEEQYTMLKDIDMSVHVEMLDYHIRCSDDKYQKISIQNIGPALWRSDSMMYQAVMAKYNEVKKFIPMSIATNISAEDYLRKINQINQFYANPNPQAFINGARNQTNVSSFLRPSV
jgi:hypothetical protein